MKPRWLTLLLLVTAALVCYAIGSIAGLTFFIILGLGFELYFWVKVFGGKKR
jgi:hypothetical protein